MLCDAVRVQGHDGRDLQRRRRRIRPDPKRCAVFRFGDRQGERQPTVRQGDGQQPVAKLLGLGAGDRVDLGQHFEGVERGGRLALGRTQIGFETMAVAAVGVAVGGERGQRRLWVARPTRESVAVPVEQACVAGEECRRRRHVVRVMSTQ